MTMILFILQQQQQHTADQRCLSSSQTHKRLQQQSYVTSHSGQLSLLCSEGWEMSTGQRRPFSSGWEITEGMIHSIGGRSLAANRFYWFHTPIW